MSDNDYFALMNLLTNIRGAITDPSMLFKFVELFSKWKHPCLSIFEKLLPDNDDVRIYVLVALCNIEEADAVLIAKNKSLFCDDFHFLLL